MHYVNAGPTFLSYNCRLMKILNSRIRSQDLLGIRPSVAGKKIPLEQRAILVPPKDFTKP